MKSILLTGGSTGIGLATALMLMDNGYKVYSGSRRGGGNAQKSNKSKGEIIPVSLDINDENSLKKIVEKIVEETGELHAVVCNAGNGIAGAIEETTSEEIKYQFETNFFGTVKTIQACLPQFRKQNFGKIIAVGSVAGIIAVPYQASYSASKAALHIFMDSLSMEIKPFGVQCCTVMPGDTKTDFTTARKYSEKSNNKTSPYYNLMKQAVGKMEKDEQNGMKPEKIACAIMKQIKRKKMCSRIIPGLDYKAFSFMNDLLPNSLKLKIVNSIYS
ncbi:MAG: SDR family oxidoreductase [Paludibacteraceae bacterium]